MRHQRVIETVRRTRRTLFVIGGFYVGIGFLIAIGAALAGDRLSAFLGFLIISGALGFAAVLTLVLRLSVRVSAIGECVDQVNRRLKSIEESGQTKAETKTSEQVEQPWCMLDLSAIGPGDPSILAAATLDRAEFPRLVASMEEAPPPDAVALQVADSTADSPQPGSKRDATSCDEAADSAAPCSLADKNPMRVWKVAMREGDLATCREVWSTLIDTAEPELVTKLNSQLEELSMRLERSLRTTFVQCVRQQDYEGALTAGEQISRLFPDQPIAREFDKLEPHLRRRARETLGRPAPPLAVVP